MISAILTDAFWRNTATLHQHLGSSTVIASNIKFIPVFFTIVSVRRVSHPFIICLIETTRSGAYINIRFSRSHKPSLFIIVFENPGLSDPAPWIFDAVVTMSIVHTIISPASSADPASFSALPHGSHRQADCFRSETATSDRASSYSLAQVPHISSQMTASQMRLTLMVTL